MAEEEASQSLEAHADAENEDELDRALEDSFLASLAKASRNPLLAGDWASRPCPEHGPAVAPPYSHYPPTPPRHGASPPGKRPRVFSPWPAPGVTAPPVSPGGLLWTPSPWDLDGAKEDPSLPGPEGREKAQRGLPTPGVPQAHPETLAKISFQFPGWHVDMERSQAGVASSLLVHHHNSVGTPEDATPSLPGPDSGPLWHTPGLGEHTPFLCLPTDILRRILLRLQPRALCSLRGTCCTLQAAAGADDVWAPHVDVLLARMGTESLLSGLLPSCRLTQDAQSTGQRSPLPCPRHMEFKLGEQSRRLAHRFLVLRRGYHFLADVFQRWWDHMERAGCQEGAVALVEEEQCVLPAEFKEDGEDFWQQGEHADQGRGRGGGVAVDFWEEPSAEEQTGKRVRRGKRASRRRSWQQTRDEGGAENGLAMWPAGEEQLCGREDNGMVGVDDAGEDNDRLCAGESARVRKVVRKLTDLDWTLVYEAVTHAFSHRAHLIAAQVQGLLPAWHREGDVVGSPGHTAEQPSLGPDSGGLRGASPGTQGTQSGVGEQASQDWCPRWGSSARASAWAAVGEWEAEWALDMGSSTGSKTLLLRAGSSKPGSTDTRPGDPVHQYEIFGVKARQGTGDRPQRPGRAGSPPADQGSTGAHPHWSLLRPGHALSSTAAAALWGGVVRLWGVYRRWLKLVSGHCTLLQFEVMLERSRGGVGQQACTPTVYDKGVICFRNSVLLSFGNRRVLQEALSSLLHSCEGSGTTHPASLCGEVSSARGASAGRVVFWNSLFGLVLSMRHMYQEMDVPDDKTLPPATFTQHKFRRCFGALEVQ